MLIKLMKCHPLAQVPTQEYGNVGFDIYAVESTEVPPASVTKVRTGLIIADYDSAVSIAESDNLTRALTVYPKIEGRSGLASKGVFPVGGIIDPNYRGEISVTLANVGTTPWTIKGPTTDGEPGDRIAQLVFYPCVTLPAIEFSEVDYVVMTNRGSKGFGSSGR